MVNFSNFLFSFGVAAFAINFVCGVKRNSQIKWKGFSPAHPVSLLQSLPGAGLSITQE
jgi:hypothetical protein